MHAKQFPVFSRLDDPIVPLGLAAMVVQGAVLAEAAKRRVTSLPTWLIVEGVYGCLQFGLSGVAIGVVYGKSARAA